MMAKEPTSIYAATRILLNHVVDKNQFPTLNFDESHEDYDWDEPAYREFLGRMVDAPIAKENNKLTFFFKLNSSIMRKDANLVEVFPSTFQTLYPVLAKELDDAHNLEVRAQWPFFGIFVCEPDPSWIYHYEALYKGNYQEPKENWKSYKVYNHEFPTEAELKSLKGVVVSGSSLAAYVPLDWYSEFHKTLKTLILNQSQTKILGVCFGHQSIATAMGGKVARMELTDIPECLHRERIIYQKSENQLVHDLLDKFVTENVFYGVECHGDHVEELPTEARLIGISRMTTVEMYEIGTSVICTQFHPEFNGYYMERKIFPQSNRELREKWPNIDELTSNNTRQIYETRCDNHGLNNLIRTFLKSY